MAAICYLTCWLCGSLVNIAGPFVGNRWSEKWNRRVYELALTVTTPPIKCPYIGLTFHTNCTESISSKMLTGCPSMGKNGITLSDCSNVILAFLTGHVEIASRLLDSGVSVFSEKKENPFLPFVLTENLNIPTTGGMSRYIGTASSIISITVPGGGRFWYGGFPRGSYNIIEKDIEADAFAMVVIRATSLSSLTAFRRNCCACISNLEALACNSALSRSVNSATRFEYFCSITRPTTTIIQNTAEIVSTQCQKTSLKCNFRVAPLIRSSTPSPATPIITSQTPISARDLEYSSSTISNEYISDYYRKLIINLQLGFTQKFACFSVNIALFNKRFSHQNCSRTTFCEPLHVGMSVNAAFGDENSRRLTFDF
jgi:hypothetical protein